jgi:leucyl aminopeptidase
LTDALIPSAETSTPILGLYEDEVEALFSDAWLQAFAATHAFKGQKGKLLLVPGADGRLAKVLWGLGKRGSTSRLAARSLSARLPAGDYHIEAPAEVGSPQALATGWALGSYVFDRYKTRDDRARAKLVVGQGQDEVRHIGAACALVRDMVNTPAADMGPLQIETLAREIAQAHGARIDVVTGDDLLEQNYPAIHAVGRAAAPHRAPRIIEITWNKAKADLPLVALVGKGVVFDSGGLDIKGASGMRLMKKDMGGAAHALALGRLIMQADLPVRLVVLLPVVENAISGDAFRPGDVLASRKGLSIEIGNTDAEGRLILADALARAAELEPELTLDFATLTGAARVALGPDLPPFFTDDETLAAELQAAALAEDDPLWRMPLWDPYEDAIDTEIADVKNDGADWAQAGALTAALFLRRFAPTTGSWGHFDIYAWNPRGRPGWPTGAEVQAIRGVYRALKDRYGPAR